MDRLVVASSLPGEDTLGAQKVGTLVRRWPALVARLERLWRHIFVAASAAVLLVTLGFSFFYFERAQATALVLAAAALVTLAWATGWLATRRGLTLALFLDVSLVFAYLWSLDERVPVTIYATPHGYVAQVGDNTLALPIHPGGGDIGLYSGDIHGYVVQPAAGHFDPATPLAPLVSWLRFAAPKPAWSAVAVSGPSARAAPSSSHLAPGWSWNRRGELEAALNASPLLLPAPGRTYRFSAGLMRGDGTQGVIVQVTRSRGYVLLIRSDQDRAYWVPWLGRPRPTVRWTGRGTHVAHLSPSVVPMVQRTLLVALPSVILALTLVLMVVPCYAVFRVLHLGVRRLFTPRRKDEPASLITNRGDRTRPRLSGACDLAAIVIATWGLLVAAYIATGVLKAVPNVQDSVAYLFQAKVFAAGRLWAPIPRLPDFFQETYLLMYQGHWFGKYAPGWPVVLAIGVRLGLAWLVNPVLLAGCLLLTYLIGKLLYGRAVALLGTAFAATSPFLLYFAGTYMAHTAALFWFLAAVYLLLRWYQTEARRGGGCVLTLRGWRFLVPAGVSLGMAAATRELDTIGLVLPFAVLFVRRPLAISWIAVATAVPVSLGLVFNRALTGSVFTNPYALVHPWDRLGFGAGVGDPAWHAAYTPALALWNLASDIQLLQVNLFGWPYYFGLACAAVPFVTGRARRWDVLLGASAAGVLAVYLAYFYSGDWLGFPRYAYGAIPWLALLTARGIQELYTIGLGLPISRRPSRPAALVFPLLLSLGLLAYSWAVFMPAERSYLAARVQGDDLPLRTVRHAHIHHALVFTATPTAWWRFGEVMTENAPLLDGDVVFARDLGPSDRRLMRLYPGRRDYSLNGTTLTRLRS
jgi:hypothetical protein